MTELAVEAPRLHTVEVTVNGASRSAAVEARLLLVHFLRETLGLTGTHIGCDTSSCGVCTVLLDGTPVKSCTLFAVQANGREITTVEGLAPKSGRLHPLQEALREHHGLQCGFCTPGVLMTLTEFLSENPSPTDAEVREVLSGHLCRCTGYHGIIAAALDAARRMRK